MTTKQKKHFDKLVEITGETWWGNTTQAGFTRLQRRANLIIQELLKIINPKVLEIGCGTGILSKLILKSLPQLYFTGCDISPKAIQIALVKCARYKNASFNVTDASSTHYDPNTFDAIIGNSVLHHVPLKKTLKECFRILKPNRFIWFTEPNMANLEVFIERHIKFIGKKLQNADDETAFFRKDLVKELKQENFKNITILPFDFLHPLTPKSLIKIGNYFSIILEKIPLIKEFSGSLLIYAQKPITQTKSRRHI